MKQMKKILIIFAFTILVVFGIYANKNTTLAATSTKFYLKSSSNQDVKIGEDVEINVCINSAGIDGLQGVVIYDGDLKLKEVKMQNEFENVFQYNAYEPNLNTSNEVTYKSDSSKKVFGFDGSMWSQNNNSNVYTGDMTIFKLIFDTSKCKEGKTYEFSWDTSTSKIVGDKTIATKSNKKQMVDVQGTSIKMEGTQEEGNKTSDKDDNTIPGKTNENKNTTGDNKDNNKNNSDDNDNNKNNNNSKNNDKLATTVAENNVEKIPQTGSKFLTCFIIILAITEIGVFISYKKMKKYNGI